MKKIREEVITENSVDQKGLKASELEVSTGRVVNLKVLDSHDISTVQITDEEIDEVIEFLEEVKTP